MTGQGRGRLSTWAIEAFAAGVGCCAAAWVLRSPAMLAVGAAALGPLVAARRASRPAVALDISAPATAAGGTEVRLAVPPRCFTGDTLPVRVTVRFGQPAQHARLVLTPTRHAHVDGPSAVRADDATGIELNTRVRFDRWGRHRLGTLTLSRYTDDGMRRADTTRTLARTVSVYPHPAQVDLPSDTVDRIDRAGEHRSRHPGPGVEFLGLRPFASGDRPADVNWPLSLRRDELWVTTRATERSVDLVLVLDLLTDGGPPDARWRDTILTAALGITRAGLHQHDRVGVTALGGRLRWIPPGSSRRQFLRIAEAAIESLDPDHPDVLDSRDAPDPGQEATLPRLPAGADAIMLTPLTDPRAHHAAATVAQRGHRLVIIDVLGTQPPSGTPVHQLAVRLWEIERRHWINQLRALGAHAIAWTDHTDLHTLLRAAAIARTRRPRVRA